MTQQWLIIQQTAADALLQNVTFSVSAATHQALDFSNGFGWCEPISLRL
ncbi:hypothetical protein [Sphaerothrix gracilis]